MRDYTVFTQDLQVWGTVTAKSSVDAIRIAKQKGVLIPIVELKKKETQQ